MIPFKNWLQNNNPSTLTRWACVNNCQQDRHWQICWKQVSSCGGNLRRSGNLLPDFIGWERSWQLWGCSTSRSNWCLHRHSNPWQLFTEGSINFDPCWRKVIRLGCADLPLFWSIMFCAVDHWPFLQIMIIIQKKLMLPFSFSYQGSLVGDPNTVKLTSSDPYGTDGCITFDKDP